MGENRAAGPRHGDEIGNSVCALIFHFGALPPWLALWKHTALKNPTFTFWLFQDQLPNGRDENVIYRNMSLLELNQLPQMRAEGLHCSHPYKICDFRPLLPFLFPHVVERYEYWGWGDLDVFYGDLGKTLGPSLGRFDYVATGWRGESGPLAFLRSAHPIFELWRSIPHVKSRLNHDDGFALDERAFVELLKGKFRCDLTFRECLLDLPAVWRDGSLTSLRSGREYALHHFGGRLKGSQSQVARVSRRVLSRLGEGKGFRIGRDFRIGIEHLFLSRLESIFYLPIRWFFARDREL